jgi:hypothetical protein
MLKKYILRILLNIPMSLFYVKIEGVAEALEINVSSDFLGTKKEPKILHLINNLLYTYKHFSLYNNDNYLFMKVDGVERLLSERLCLNNLDFSSVTRLNPLILKHSLNVSDLRRCLLPEPV